MLTFIRSLQVDGGAPLELKLTIVRIARTSLTFSVLLLLAIGGVVAIHSTRKAPDRQ